MPTYIKDGQVVDKRPPLYIAYQWVQEVYLALSLFLWSLFNPNAQHKLPASRSLREARDRRREESGAPAGPGGNAGGAGGSTTRRGGQMTLNDIGGGPVVSGMQGGCAGGSCG